jgi:excisionase family DNA binding protein
MSAGMFLTVTQVAERLHLSRQTVLRLIDAGVIPAAILRDNPVRRLVRVPAEALEAALRDRSLRRAAS